MLTRHVSKRYCYLLLYFVELKIVLKSITPCAPVYIADLGVTYIMNYDVPILKKKNTLMVNFYLNYFHIYLFDNNDELCLLLRAKISIIYTINSCFAAFFLIKFSHELLLVKYEQSHSKNFILQQFA